MLLCVLRIGWTQAEKCIFFFSFYFWLAKIRNCLCMKCNLPANKFNVFMSRSFYRFARLAPWMMRSIFRSTEMAREWKKISCDSIKNRQMEKSISLQSTRFFLFSIFEFVTTIFLSLSLSFYSHRICRCCLLTFFGLIFYSFVSFIRFFVCCHLFIFSWFFRSSVKLNRRQTLVNYSPSYRKINNANKPTATAMASCNAKVKFNDGKLLENLHDLYLWIFIAFRFYQFGTLLCDFSLDIPLYSLLDSFYFFVHFSIQWLRIFQPK